MDMLDMAMLGLVIIGLLILVAGFRQKVVIYYEVEELFVSLLAVLLPVGAYLMAGIPPFNNALLNDVWRWLLIPLVGVLGILCLLCNFKQAWQHSHDFGLTLLVGLFRLVFVSLVIVVLAGLSEQLAERKPSQSRQARAWILIALAGLLTRSLVNGERVYRNKGWLTVK